MSLESRFRSVVGAFGQRESTAAEGAIFRPPAPIDLPAFLGRGVARRLMAERIEPLFEFGVGTAPGGNAAGLGMLWIGRIGGLVCADLPHRAPVALAALLPASDPALIATFLMRFMAKNGTTFGVDFLHRLPPWIRNQRCDLLDRRAMKRALWRWMTWAERSGVTSWQVMRHHVADRWGRDDWSETLSHEDRGRLLGMYLAASYIELPHVGRRAVDADTE